MDELKLVVASNLILLRQKAGLTQAELGEKLNYSDKTVSKWERAESIPDAFVLTQLAAIYGITVDDILRPADTWEEQQEKRKAAEKERERKFSASVVSMVAIAGIWTMAVMTFVILWLAIDAIFWILFPCAVLVSLIAILVFNSIWNQGRGNTWIVMVLVAMTVALIYLFLLPFNPWQLFLILIPAEILVFLCFRIRSGPRARRKTSGTPPA